MDESRSPGLVDFDYGLIPGPSTEKTTLMIERPAFEVVRDIHKWNDLDKAIKLAYPHLNIDREDVIPNLAFDESSLNLVAGTVNLINLIRDRDSQGDPIDTIMFLDKSARPGAYIFNLMWKKLHGTEGIEAAKKPKIRFMNTGYEDGSKHSDPSSLKMLDELYRPEDISGHVLVVDEVFMSGSTARQAGVALHSSGYHPRRVEAVQQFASCPSWYTKDLVKGVNETSELNEDVRGRIGRLPKRLGKTIKDLSHAVGVRNTMGLLTGEVDGEPYLPELNREQANRLMTERLNVGLLKAELALRTTLMKLKTHEVVEYFATNANFTALPPNDETKNKTREYRGVLKFMVEEAVARGMVLPKTYT